MVALRNGFLKLTLASNTDSSFSARLYCSIDRKGRQTFWPHQALEALRPGLAVYTNMFPENPCSTSVFRCSAARIRC